MSPVPEDNKSRDDPEKNGQEVSNLEMPQFTVNVATSSDSEEEDTPNGGYQLLPQDPEGDPPYSMVHVDGSSGDENEPESLEYTEIDGQHSAGADHVHAEQAVEMGMEGQLVQGDVPPYMQVPVTQFGESVERTDLWNKQLDSTLEVDKDKADKIRAAMSSFSVPPPAWAKVIPEEQWKSKLVSSLKGQPVQQTNPWKEEPSVAQVEKQNKTQQSASPDKQDQSPCENWANFCVLNSEKDGGISREKKKT